MGWQDAPLVEAGAPTGGSWRDAPLVGTKAPAAAVDDPSLLERAAGGAVEPLASLVTGAVAEPIAGWAGIAGGLLPGPQGQAADWAHKTLEALTYQPKSQGGKDAMSVITKPFELLAEGADIAGEKVREATGSNALAAGVNTAIQAAPQLLGAKGAKATAKGVPSLLPERAPKLLEPDPARDAVRQSAQDAGYITPPERGIKAAAAGMAGKARVEKIISERNERTATERLGTEAGIPGGQPLTQSVLESGMERQYKVYDALKAAAGPEVKVTPEFRQSIRDSLDAAKSEVDLHPELKPAIRILEAFKKRTPGESTLTPPIANTLREMSSQQPGAPMGPTSIGGTIAKQFLDQPQIPAPPSGLMLPPSKTVPAPTLPTSFVADQISQLRKAAKRDYRVGNYETGEARLGIANQLEGLMERQIGDAGPEQLAAFRQARTKLAQLHLLDAIANDATGRVDLSKLANLSDSPAYKKVLTGEFRIAADFAKTFRKAAQKGVGEALPRLSVFDGLFALGSIAAGHPIAAGVELGGRFAIPEMARRGMLQNGPPGAPGWRPPAMAPAFASMLPFGAGAYSQLESPP